MIGVVLVLCLLPNPVSDGYSEAGRRAYLAGDYERAHRFYEAALGQPGVSKAHVFYNLANCSFRLGRYAEALLHYRCAQRRMPGDREIEWNLSLTRQRLGVLSEVSPSLATRLLAHLDAVSPRTMLGIIFTLQTLGLLGLVLVHGHRGARALCLAASLTGLVLAVRVVAVHEFPGPPEAIALDQVSLRTEPHATQPVAVELEPGQAVQVIEMSDRWAHVVTPDGEGWVERGGIGIVD